MIILLASQKGGCGKSTLVTNLAAYSICKKNDTVILDADSQATASTWAGQRQESGSPLVPALQKYGDIKSTLKDLRSRYANVIVDTAGRDSKEMRTALLEADVVLVPFRPSQPDLDTLTSLDEILAKGKDLSPNMKVYAVLTMVPTNTKVKEREEAVDIFTEYASLTLLKAVIHDRKVYRDAIAVGLGVTEGTNEKAQKEIIALAKEIKL